jgi:hypothetical protein
MKEDLYLNADDITKHCHSEAPAMNPEKCPLKHCSLDSSLRSE